MTKDEQGRPMTYWGGKEALAETQEADLSKCPKCGGEADNGHDRCIPPSPYYCTKCNETQKPVAWKDKIYGNLHHADFGDSIPLYATPPSREWQRLQNDEIYKILNDNIGGSSYTIARAISEALREKNNG